MNAEKFKSLLLQKQQQLIALDEDAVHGAEVVELDQTRVGRLSRMDAMQQQQMNLESQRRRSRELLALDAALKRIDAGEYGLCQQCDEEINPDRLEIDPVAVLCINCASKREHARNPR